MKESRLLRRIWTRVLSCNLDMIFIALSRACALNCDGLTSKQKTLKLPFMRKLLGNNKIWPLTFIYPMFPGLSFEKHGQETVCPQFRNTSRNAF